MSGKNHSNVRSSLASGVGAKDGIPVEDGLMGNRICQVPRIYLQSEEFARRWKMDSLVLYCIRSMMSQRTLLRALQHESIKYPYNSVEVQVVSTHDNSSSSLDRHTILLPWNPRPQTRILLERLK